MNTELIRLSRKAAKEWAATDGYSQASQIVNMLCDELEAIAPEQSLTPKEEAYQSLAKHIFRAHRKYEGGKVLVLLADDIREAEQLAMTAFGASSVFVKRVSPTEDPQVWEV